MHSLGNQVSIESVATNLKKNLIYYPASRKQPWKIQEILIFEDGGEHIHLYEHVFIVLK